MLLNTQIVAFPLLARCLQGQRVTRAFLISAPMVLIGVALVGGLGQSGRTASLPITGVLMGGAAGVAYAAYLYVSRQGSSDAPGHAITGLLIARWRQQRPGRVC